MTDSKPRQWWIVATGESREFAFPTDPRKWTDPISAHVVHVIEKSYADSLEQRLEQSEAQLLTTEGKLAEVQVAMRETGDMVRSLYAPRVAELEAKLAELDAEIEALKKERTTYRTLNALLGDNGQVCELYDDIEALEAKLAERDAELKRLQDELESYKSDCAIDHKAQDTLIAELEAEVAKLAEANREMFYALNERDRERQVTQILEAVLRELPKWTIDQRPPDTHPAIWIEFIERLASKTREALEAAKKVSEG